MISKQRFNVFNPVRTQMGYSLRMVSAQLLSDHRINRYAYASGTFGLKDFGDHFGLQYFKSNCKKTAMKITMVLDRQKNKM